jgi:hypothetical protein
MEGIDMPIPPLRNPVHTASKMEIITHKQTKSGATAFLSSSFLIYNLSATIIHFFTPNLKDLMAQW